MKKDDIISNVLYDCFQTPGAFEPNNITDALFAIAAQLGRIANAMEEKNNA